MAPFRADEAEQTGYERAKRYLISREFSAEEQAAAAEQLDELILEHGPVVDAYPTWHPLVPKLRAGHPVTVPSDLCGYKGLDHTILFANAFVSCPYGDGSELLNSIEGMRHRQATISARPLDTKLYFGGTTAVLVSCEWDEHFNGHMIPKRLAVPLMIEEEMKMWGRSEVGETWETMRRYLLGVPHGSRSSLFVTQETALAMKRVYTAMVESGMYGPLMLD